MILLLRAIVLIIVTTFAALTTPVADAIVLSDKNDRVVTPGQPAYGVNLDGVALLGLAFNPSPQSTADIAGHCSGALISSHHFLTAAHCLDEDGNGQTDAIITDFPLFAAFELNDLNVFLQLNTTAVHYPAEWPLRGDLAIIELLTDAPHEIPRYPLYGLTDEVGRQIVIAGYGNTGYGATGVDEAASAAPKKRAGLNRYEGIRDGSLLVYDFDSGQEQNNALAMIGLESDLGFGLDEVSSAWGDSGGPVFIDGVIAGITAFGDRLATAGVDDIENISSGEAGFDTRVSSYRDFIISATGGYRGRCRRERLGRRLVHRNGHVPGRYNPLVE
jgi:secreted trypsin-like serine protease